LCQNCGTGKSRHSRSHTRTGREAQRMRSQSCNYGGRSPGREEARTCLWRQWGHSVLSSSQRRRLRLLQQAQMLYQPPKAGMPANRRGASTASEPWPTECGFPKTARAQAASIVQYALLVRQREKLPFGWDCANLLAKGQVIFVKQDKRQAVSAVAQHTCTPIRGRTSRRCH